MIVEVSVADLPPPAELRAELYRGRIFRVNPTAASLELIERLTELVRTEFPGVDLRQAQFADSPPEFFRRMGLLRRAAYSAPWCLAGVRAVQRSLGVAPAENALDPPRLRSVQHRGHEEPAAAAVYFAHRDIWYGHPPSMLTWWLPLHDVEPAETFEFHPDCFDRPVPNDSEGFDFDAWVARGPELRIGWQKPEAGLTEHYSRLVAETDRLPGRAVGFGCPRGGILLFAGAHLHRTVRQTTGRTRFSVDFRTVHLEDHRAGRGAPNVDNRSRGNALPHYVSQAEP